MDLSKPTPRPYIIFGYGSLIWKVVELFLQPPPHVIQQQPGYLKGYVRRFAQKSHDHRGTPENPGRVCTLIHSEDWQHYSASVSFLAALGDIQDAFPHDDVVWGVAYTIDPACEAEVRDYLEYREKDGYTLEIIDIYGLVEGVETVIIPQAFCYVGRPDNPSFIGSEPLEVLAQRIWISEGPSGPNKEYLYNLAESVHKLAPEAHDSHLFALETRLKELDKGTSWFNGRERI